MSLYHKNTCLSRLLVCPSNTSNVFPNLTFMDCRRLDQEFSAMLTKIADRKNELKVSENKLGQLRASKRHKDEEMKSLERKLVVLLEAQETQLAELHHRQEKHRGDLADNEDLVVTSSHTQVNGFRGPSEREKQQTAQLMESTETMMKFGFMSMSMTYFGSLNMVKAMKKVAAQDTVMAAVSRMEIKSQEKKSNDALTKKVPLSLGIEEGPPINVRGWTVEDVVKWLSTISLSQYGNYFREGAVDGPFLCELTDDDLRNTLGVEHKLHRKKILFNIGQLSLPVKVESDKFAADSEFIAEGISSKVFTPHIHEMTYAETPTWQNKVRF